MNKKNKLGVVFGWVLLGFLMIGFVTGIKANLFVSQLSKHTEMIHAERFQLRAELTSGSPIAMLTKKKKLEAVHKWKEAEQNDTVAGSVSLPVLLPKKDLRLIPGGQSIGVQLNTKGVLVVGYHLVTTSKGESSPGESAGIRVGDVITKINGRQMGSINDVRKFMTHMNQEKPLHVTLIRQRSTMEKKLTPILDVANQRCQLGLFIRDSASGIGTMTFYDPISGSYGALGHVIADRDTGQPIMVKNGRIVRSIVQAIDRGQEGKPGEKIAFFPKNALSIGSVAKNTPFGIYGKMQKNYLTRSDMLQKALPIATASQVQEGPAQILTVLNGNRVEAFDIRILNSIPQKHAATKGLVLKITDPKLLKATGGIVQGMSGSPIIQNGRLVGAVTHVFVNDPTSGYGVHIEWMINEAGLQDTQHSSLQKQIAS
ncbi:SpoIVB peptidase [Sporolactobacillus terrae]|uniref:SpoIVB peptidase n=1 Tax=Sporolactobacillus terrae TaxID=269673 RepID=UPI00048F3AFC|nr:SpoIVB peptidase [Sporolactobacillus terrae]